MIPQNDGQSLSFKLIRKLNHKKDVKVFAVGKTGFNHLKQPDDFESELMEIATPNDFPLHQINRVVNGDVHTILVGNGQVFGIGSNANGQLGCGPMLYLETISRLPIADDLTIVNAYCGSYHTILLAINGEIWVTGDCSFKQTGYENQENVKEFTKLEIPCTVTEVATSYSHTLYYCKSSNRLFGTGESFYH